LRWFGYQGSGPLKQTRWTQTSREIRALWTRIRIAFVIGWLGLDG
jgi:hypothetical protein